LPASVLHGSTQSDVVRHPLVQKIVEAYDRLQTDEDEGSRRSVTG
jgi:phosphate starvation-inducible protein PhoH